MTGCHRIILLMLVLSCAFTLAARANDEDAQRQVATRFIQLYFLSDGKELPATLAQTGPDLFGPYPFQGAIVYGPVKVKDRQASLDFFANSVEGKYPPSGAIIFWRLRENEQWRVRQVLLYTGKPPVFFGLPTHSVTAQDRAFEPQVIQVGATFMNAWMKADKKKMAECWYDWPKTPREPQTRLSLANLNLNLSKTAWTDGFAQYSVKMTYTLGVLHYSMDIKGGLILGKVGKEWRVRANLLVLNFE